MSARRSKAYLALCARLAADYRNAPIIEVNEQYRDTFERDNEGVSVELCHGIWRTFRRGSDLMPRSHESRETAKAYARVMLGLQ